MLVKIDINKLSGRVQIAVLRLGQMTGHSLTYPSPVEAKNVLLALGISALAVDRQLEILAEIGPRELLHFGEVEVSEARLANTGFHP
jgi:hypothetical protein